MTRPSLLIEDGNSRPRPLQRRTLHAMRHAVTRIATYLEHPLGSREATTACLNLPPFRRSL